MTGPRCPDYLLGLLKGAWEAAPSGNGRGTGREGWDLVSFEVALNNGALAPNSIVKIWASVLTAAHNHMPYVINWMKQSVVVCRGEISHNAIWDCIGRAAASTGITTECVILWQDGPPTLPDALTQKETVPRLVNTPRWDRSSWTLTGYLWHPEGSSWGVVACRGSIKMVRPTISSVVRERVLTRTDNPRDPAWRSLAQRKYCSSTRCRGPLGHCCQLVDAGYLPKGLAPLVDALGLEVDLCADVFHVCDRPSITKWYSKSPKDIVLGAEGNALSSEMCLKGRMLAFPPPRQALMDRLLIRVSNSILRDVGLKEMSLCLLWTPLETLPVLNCQVMRLGSVEATLTPAPDSFMTDREDSMVQVGPHTLWLLLPPSPGPPPAPLGTSWEAMEEALNSWSSFTSDDSLRRAALEERAIRMAREIVDEGLLAVNVMARIQSLAADFRTRRDIMATPDERADVERLGRQIVSEVRREVLRKWRKGGPVHELARIVTELSLDVADRPAADRLPHAVSGPRGVGTYPDENIVDWVAFMQSREGVCTMVGPDWPSVKLLERHQDSVWVVLWTETQLAREVRPTLFQEDSGLECVEWALGTNPYPQSGRRSRIYVDVGGQDCLLLLLS